ncbi:argininosuccinate lyase [Massospora cicadina]|nr:argininosuccinate lyase [Massospora cicadina]
MDEFDKSIHYDRRLYKADIFGSQAYAHPLARKGIISKKEEDSIIKGLDQLRKECEIIGPTVATDTRLWLREQSEKLEAVMHKMIELFVQRAEADVRLSQLKDRFNLLPLGSGALAGNPFEIDRLAIAKELGYAGVVQNSLVGVSDRDFINEFLFWASMTMLHISQISEDLILWNTAEFGFVQLHECYTTGSSLMPQNKNLDSLELLRVKSGVRNREVKGLPSSYNKDMQEDKEPLFDAVDTPSSCIPLMGSIIHTLTIDPENMKSALSEDMLATDMADYLVRKGVPFRETYHMEVPLSQLPLDILKELHTKFESDVASLGGDFAGSANRRNAIGGTSLTQVKDQIQTLKD